jgi:membrane protease YdiL (CAAX protease family)
MGRPSYVTVPLALLFYGAVGGVAVLCSMGTAPGLALLTRPPASQPLPWWLAGVLAGSALVGATRAAERWWPAMRTLAADLAGLLGPCTWPRVLLLASLSGVGEEALFRGPVQHVAGLWLTSLVFGGLHGGGRRGMWPWTVFAVIAGLLFGWLAQRYASPWPAAVAHVLVNAINLRRLGRYQREA